MAIVKLDQVANADDLPTKHVPVPEWGGDVIVRAFTSTQRDYYQKNHVRRIGTGDDVTLEVNNCHAWIVCNCCMDDNGDRLFKDSDMAMLGRKNGEIIARIAKEVIDISGIGDKPVKDAEKNSETTQP